MRYPPITKHNIDAWNNIVYHWIIVGMTKDDPDLSYGESMRMAEKVTNLLFNALKFKMRNKKK